MELYHSIRIYYLWIGMNPPKLNQIYLYSWIKIFVFTSLTLAFVLVAGFFLFEAKSIVEYGFSFYISSAVLFVVLNLLLTYLEMPNTLKLIERFEQFVEMRSSTSTSRDMYNELNVKIERTSHSIYFGIVYLSFIGAMIPALLITMANYFIFNMEEESFYLPFPAMLPINWKTPLGYLICWGAESVTAILILFCTTPCICFLNGTSWLFISFVQDIANDLEQLNGDQFSNRCDQVTTEYFRSITKSYTHVKQLVDEYNSVYELKALLVFLLTLLLVSSSLLAVLKQLSADNSNPVKLATLLVLVIWANVPIFFFCESGQAVSNQFDAFRDELYQCEKWYLFPMNVKRMMIILLSNRPTFLRAYGNILNTRESFKTTTHGGFSYFMALRQIDG